MEIRSRKVMIKKRSNNKNHDQQETLSTGEVLEKLKKKVQSMDYAINTKYY